VRLIRIVATKVVEIEVEIIIESAVLIVVVVVVFVLTILWCSQAHYPSHVLVGLHVRRQDACATKFKNPMRPPCQSTKDYAASIGNLATAVYPGRQLLVFVASDQPGM
jgi:hypothetical protein